MKLNVIEKNFLSRLEIFFLVLSFLFFIFRATAPFLKYPFILCYGIILLLSLIKFKDVEDGFFSKLVKNYYLIFLNIILLIFAFLVSNKHYLLAFKDILNSLVIISIFIFATILVKEDRFKEFFSSLFNFVLIFAILLALLGFCNLLTIFKSNLTGSDSLSAKQYLGLDINFGIVPIIFAIIELLFLLPKSRSKSSLIFINLLLTFFFITIPFSASRRGLLIMLLIIISLLFIIIYQWRRGHSEFGLKIFPFFISTFIIFFSVWLYISFASYSFKNKSLELVGSKNIELAKENITWIVAKYDKVLKRNSSFTDIYNKLWSVIPEDPDSGWGTRKHKTVFPLSGYNYEIVPLNAKGYLIDKNSDADSRYNNAYSNTIIAVKNIRNDVILNASVYCFVSREYNGDWVNLSCGGPSEGKVNAFYDLNNKGKWQKLSISAKCSSGIVPVSLYICKSGVNDFSTLTGSVIFAYPLVETKFHKDSLTSMLTPINPVFSCMNNMEIHKKHNYIRKPYLNMTFSHVEISSASFGIKPIFSAKMMQNETDPLRNFVDNLFVEDTTYHPLKSNISMSDNHKVLLDNRILRWEFALKIFSEEYSGIQKFFGDGFNFLNWYGYYFSKDKKVSDYPHNPFLHVLLYSGILGLSLYLILIFRVLYLYLKYFREYSIFFIFFLITGFFTFFSGGSPFDPPITGFFMILPFFIHYANKSSTGKKNQYRNLKL